MNHIKQLDAIRGVCLIIVILTHWTPNDYAGVFYVFYYFSKYLNIGEIALTTFFVLSGFLITRILLNDRHEAEEYNLSKFFVMKNFIMRRTLRIFPAYYLTLIVFYIFGSRVGSHIREDFFYYITHFSNFALLINQRWDNLTSHFWSLAVEEQFYLFWPWIMLFVNKKYLKQTILFFLFAGIFSNYLFTMFIPVNGYTLLTMTCFDSFSIGGFLAYLMVYQKDKLNEFIEYLLPAAFACYNLYLFSVFFKSNVFIPHRTLVSVCSLYLIVYAMRQKKGIIHNVFLNNRFFLFFGKISYSMYLLHVCLPYLWGYLNWFLQKHNIVIFLINTGGAPLINREIIIIEMFIVLTLMAWIMWKFIENPINNLKNKFNNKPILPDTAVVKNN